MRYNNFVKYIILVAALFSCKGNKHKCVNCNTNVHLQDKGLVFYRPVNFMHFKHDSDYFFGPPLLHYQYYTNDSDEIINIYYPMSKCYFEWNEQNIDSILSYDLQHSVSVQGGSISETIIKVNGIRYIKIVEISYLANNALIKLYAQGKDRYLLFKIQKRNYLRADSQLYFNRIDSIINSIVIFNWDELSD